MMIFFLISTYKGHFFWDYKTAVVFFMFGCGVELLVCSSGALMLEKEESGCGTTVKGQHYKIAVGSAEPA